MYSSQIESPPVCIVGRQTVYLCKYRVLVKSKPPGTQEDRVRGQLTLPPP